MTDLLLQGEVDGFIELGGAPRTGLFDGAFSGLLVAGKLTLQMHFIVERDDQHLVVDMNPVDEANGFILNPCQPVDSAVAGVQDQSHGERGVHRGEVGDLLLDPVLVDPKVFLAQLGQVSSGGVGHHDVDINQVHIHREAVGNGCLCWRIWRGCG